MTAAACGMLLTWSASARAETIVIHAGSVIVDAAGEPTGPATVIVQDDRIVAVEQGHRAPAAGERVVDLRALTVLPGLVDLHVHLTSDPGGEFWRDATDPPEWSMVVGVRNARRTLKAGFTTVREAGSSGQSAFALRRATEEGVIPGPRIVAAGPPIAIIGGHGDVNGFRPDVNAVLTSGFTCTGPVECAARVRRAAQNGADVIKITATGGVLSQQGRGLEAHFSDAEMTAIVDTARSLGLKVMAHAHGARGIEAAARAGVATVEHGTYLDPPAAAAMRRSGTVLVPTLMAFQGISERLGKGVYTPVVEDKVRAVAQSAGVFLRRALDLGVPVAFGTDAGVFEHGRNAGEFRLLLAQGMTSRQALASATTDAARVLGLETQIGRLAPGFSADLIAVAGNPLRDATVLERVEWVMARGRVAE
ncbi:amidohydrolase family protein [Erythrobacteraceae bacterium CFH 75059]|nr:amidohydrolase family protein [Erythrobacteraceae bacterium CFH 75059]